MSRRKRMLDRQEYADNLRNVDKIRVLERDLAGARSSKNMLLSHIATLKERNDSFESEAELLRKKCNILVAMLGLCAAMVVILGISASVK